MIPTLRVILLGLLSAISWDAARSLANDQIPGPPQAQPIAITDATIHVVDGPNIQQGTVLFESGKITAVGKNVPLPDKVIVIDGAGKHVYPGLIESITDIGLREISAVEETDDRTEYGQLNPNARTWVAVNPDSELIPVARAEGVLVAMTAPRGRWLRGQTSVLQLDGWTAAEMALLAPAGLYVDWNAVEPREADERKQAEQRAEKLQELEVLLDQARRYGEAVQARPESTPRNVRLESLLPVIEGKLPLIAQADVQSTIESAVAFAQHHQLQLVIEGGYDAEACADLLRQYQIPVIIGSTYRLPRRRDDPYDTPYTLPLRLLKAGVKFAIAGEGQGSPGGAANARNLPYHAANAVAYGLPHDEAVRAITLSAAEILGVGNRIGSITVGKDATLIIADGDILETATNVSEAFIQGRKVDLGSRHKMLYEKYKKKYSRR